MIKLLLLLFLTLSLYANSKQDMLSLYKDSKFKESCDIGYEEGYKNKYDEEFMTIYASACLKSDYINRLSMPVSILRKTKESRANAAYFSIILMQKKLLYYAMVDKFNISTLKLPTTEHVLSIVFDLYVKATKDTQKESYTFTNPTDSSLTYKLYVTRGNIPKVSIDEYKDSQIIKQHIYW